MISFRTVLLVAVSVVALAACGKKGPTLTIKVVEYGTKTPICDGLKFEVGAGKPLGNTPMKETPATKTGDCAFELAPLPPVADAEQLKVFVTKDGYVRSNLALAGVVLQKGPVTKTLEMVKR